MIYKVSNNYILLYSPITTAVSSQNETEQAECLYKSQSKQRFIYTKSLNKWTNIIN